MIKLSSPSGATEEGFAALDRWPVELDPWQLTPEWRYGIPALLPLARGDVSAATNQLRLMPTTCRLPAQLNGLPQFAGNSGRIEHRWRLAKQREALSSNTRRLLCAE
jgi:hypothetical protein